MANLRILFVSAVIGLSHAFIEDIDSALTDPNDTDEVRVLNFNQDMSRCYTEAARNGTAAGLQSPLSICCIRDYWSLCIRSVPMAKDCSALLETRVEEFESALVRGVDCSGINIQRCPHASGRYDYHYESRGRPARFTGGASGLHGGSVTTAGLAFIIALIVISTNNAVRLLCD